MILTAVRYVLRGGSWATTEHMRLRDSRRSHGDARDRGGMGHLANHGFRTFRPHRFTTPKETST